MVAAILRVLVVALAFASVGVVRAAPVEEPAASPVVLSLVSESGGVVPGETAHLAVQVRVQDGWHVYWKNSGESGFPTQLEWNLPEGFSLLRETWSAPHRFEEEGQVCFGYDKEFLILAEFLVPREIDQQTVSLGATLTWLACRDACIPGSQTETVNLAVKNTVGSATSQWTALMGQHTEVLPTRNDPIGAAVQGNTMVLNVPAVEGASKAYFYPETDGLIDYKKEHALVANEKGYEVGVPLREVSSQPIAGVLVLQSTSGNPLQAFHVDIPSVVAASGGVSVSHLLLTLLFAFAGGLILNLMPCVLPVVSLKVFQFMNLAGSSRRHAVHHGLVFTAGVVASFWALAGLLLGLRSYGQSVGWGFQLQEPAFVVVLALLLFLLGLSLLGVFELGASLVSLGGRSQQKSGMASSFFSGVLATTVATPCTGPLLAPALGYAVTLPPILAMVVFTSLALGMAAPYLLLSAFPGAMRWLPKPGAWMVTFKQVMGFFMMATTLWLLWVFQAQVEGGTALIWLLVAMLLAALAAWIYGRFGTLVQTRPIRWVARCVAVGVLLCGGYVGIQQAASPSAELGAARHDWLAWDPETLAQLKGEGKLVFVDFTAKWCLICQTNKVPMYSQEVASVFEEHGVVKMEADWTRRDPSITQELEKFGRNGVPLYVLYSPSGDPIILPQLLTPETLIKAVNEASK